MKLCTAVQEGCGYKDTLRAHRYFALSAKYFTVCITYKPPPVFCANKKFLYFIKNKLLAFFCSLGYCVFSLLAFCKPLDLNSHFVLKIFCSVYLFICTFRGSLGGKSLIDIGIVNIDINTTTQDVYTYTYEYKHGYEKNK